jgi:phage gpG-like protein
MIVQSGKGFNFTAVTRKLARARGQIKNDGGRLAVNHFKGNFRAQGFVDSTVDPWKKRKLGDKKHRTGRGILIDSGNLRNNIRVLGAPGNRVIIGTRGIKYARRHNEGLSKMPKRQFIGNSKILEGKIHKSINKHLNNIWG